MTGVQLETVEGLVCRKGNFSETSLILHLLTRERGQVHVLAKGALRGGKRRFPAADLFRLVRVSYRAGRPGALQTARELELVTAFDALAGIPAHYTAAAWVARFALDNSVAEDPVPRLFAALLTAFTRLAGPRLPSCGPVCLGVVLTALDEHGWLPEAATTQPDAAALLAAATDPSRPLPTLSSAAWQQLREDARLWLAGSGLRLPAGGGTLA